VTGFLIAGIVTSRLRLRLLRLLPVATRSTSTALLPHHVRIPSTAVSSSRAQINGDGGFAGRAVTLDVLDSSCVLVGPDPAFSPLFGWFCSHVVPRFSREVLKAFLGIKTTLTRRRHWCEQASRRRVEPNSDIDVAVDDINRFIDRSD
jgi:hypothetical protein